ncbi:hypothetical protein [Streptomyces sp. NPDC001381]|uniref:hypothetical protein n=1 Tax=Streptomyces sp. NPDC001381 TaxID=3364567 RepID=UPI0036A17A1A
MFVITTEARPGPVVRATAVRSFVRQWSAAALGRESAPKSTPAGGEDAPSPPRDPPDAEPSVEAPPVDAPPPASVLDEPEPEPEPLPGAPSTPGGEEEAPDGEEEPGDAHPAAPTRSSTVTAEIRGRRMAPAAGSNGWTDPVTWT